MSCHCPATNWYDGKGHNPGCPLYELEQAPEIIRAAKEITELALIETDYLYVKTIEILKWHKYCARKCGDYAAEGIQSANTGHKAHAVTRRRKNKGGNANDTQW